ncbi:MAG TPA: substrate-binding domain-containing protein [Ktedonobacteraceae bacterium]|nr:substrate-binding domain-containing protein [Ktedonobacteraceae bacterium]
MKLFDRKRRSFSTAFGMILLTLLLVACGNSGTTTTTTTAAPVNGKGCTKVGILLPETASSFRWDGVDRPDLIKDISAALPAGSPAPDYNNAGGSASVQQSQAQADLTKGDCILVVGAYDGAAAAAIVSAAKAKNVPVIAYDRLIQSKDLAYYVSFDNVKVGQLQGQYIADHYQSYVSSGKNNTVMIDGAQTDNNALLFKQGAHSALDPLFSAGTLKKVYETFTPNWDNNTAQIEMNGALTASQNNISVAYVANDGMANTVIAALKAKKLNGHVLVTGQDASVAGIQHILAGDQAMTVYKAIPKQAQATADLVKALNAGSDTSSLTNGATTKTSDGTAIPSVLETPVTVDKTNIQSTVIADGFVTLADACKGLPSGTGGICP